MIKEIVKDSFTKTGQGLMTLFAIGVIHLSLGVNLENTKIAIPWFPTIKIEHPERIIYLYIGLIIYSLYRYALNSGDKYQEAKAESLKWGLNRSSGHLIIKKYITDKTYFTISLTRPDEKIKHYMVNVDSYSNDEDISESFHLIYDDMKRVNSAAFKAGPLGIALLGATKFKEDWGLYNNSDMIYPPEQVSEGYCSMEASFIRSKVIYRTFNYYNLMCMPVYAFVSPKAFDFLLPILCNVALLSYWVSITYF